MASSSTGVSKMASREVVIRLGSKHGALFRVLVMLRVSEAALLAAAVMLRLMRLVVV
jgi:hypothetical protein